MLAFGSDGNGDVVRRIGNLLHLGLIFFRDGTVTVADKAARRQT